MKKILIYAGILLFSGFWSGCEQSEVGHEYEGPWFIAFKAATQVAVESAADPVKVEVQLVAPRQNEQVKVDFELSSEDLEEGKDYELVNDSRTLTFAPGESVRYIEVQLYDNLDITGDKTLKLELKPADSGFELGSPGQGKRRDVCLLTVKDDDCPFGMETFSGRVNGYETTPWWDGVKFPATFTPVEQLSPDRIKYTVKGIFFAVQLEYAYNKWVGAGDEVIYKDIEVVIDYSDKNRPTISWEQQVCVSVLWEGETGTDDYRVAAAAGVPLELSTCDRTLGFAYHMVDPDWASSYAFTVFFNFNE